MEKHDLFVEIPINRIANKSCGFSFEREVDKLEEFQVSKTIEEYNGVLVEISMKFNLKYNMNFIGVLMWIWEDITGVDGQNLLKKRRSHPQDINVIWCGQLGATRVPCQRSIFNWMTICQMDQIWFILCIRWTKIDNRFKGN